MEKGCNRGGKCLDLVSWFSRFKQVIGRILVGNAESEEVSSRKERVIDLDIVIHEDMMMCNRLKNSARGDVRSQLFFGGEFRLCLIGRPDPGASLSLPENSPPRKSITITFSI